MKSNSLIAGFGALIALTAVTARAQTVQTATAANFDSYSTGESVTLTSIALLSDTDAILDVSGSFSIANQGWGNNIGQPLVLSLSVGGFSDVLAYAAYPGGYEGGVPDYIGYTFDLASGNPTQLANLNAALAGVDWSTGASVDITAYAAGYSGYEMHVHGLTDTVVSTQAPDGAATVGMLGFVLSAVAVARRKLVRS